MKSSDKIWFTGDGNGKPLQYSCLENPINSMKRQKRSTSTLYIVTLLIYFSFFSVTAWGIDLDYCDIEWFALEMNRGHSVVFEIAPNTAFWTLVDYGHFF